jgi:uncharacterized membrane protein
MNIHPLFVHFPIGILSTYALLEISYWLFPFVRRQAWVQHTKIFLVIFGALWFLPTAGTGDIASEIITKKPDTNKIIEMHEHFAGISMVIFMGIAACHLLILGVKHQAQLPRILAKILIFFARFEPTARKITESPLVAILAGIGLIAITITGALGAAITYGSDTDFIVTYIYRLLI